MAKAKEQLVHNPPASHSIDPPSAAASVVALSKHFGKTSVLENISFDVAEGEVLVLLGASGSGKTTILVSGNLAGRTQTAPLYIFAKFNEGQIEAANAIAIVLALFSFLIFSVLFFARDWLDVD